MPELPEVETIRQGLNQKLSNSHLCSIVRLDNYCWHDETSHFSLAADYKLSEFERQGKYLFAHLKSDTSAEDITLIFHLRMTGKLIITSTVTNLPKHSHFYFELKKDHKILYLYFNDVRRFGYVKLLPRQNLSFDQSLKKLGFDALTHKLTLNEKALTEKEAENAFIQGCRRHLHKNIKSALLDQSIIAGLGNIYADELLFSARIHPANLCCNLSEKNLQILYRSILPLLNKAISNHGTSFSDYVDSRGIKGNFQNYLQVYQRTSLPCYSCKTPIKKCKIAGRSTHFCPKCQIYYGSDTLT